MRSWASTATQVVLRTDSLHYRYGTEVGWGAPGPLVVLDIVLPGRCAPSARRASSGCAGGPGRALEWTLLPRKLRNQLLLAGQFDERRSPFEAGRFLLRADDPPRRGTPVGRGLRREELRGRG